MLVRMKTDISIRVRELLASLDITQQQLADMAGISKAAVNAWIKKGAKPSSSVLLKLRKKRGVNPDWLINGKGAMFLSNNTWESPKQLAASYINVPMIGTAELEPDGYWGTMDYSIEDADGSIAVPSNDPAAYALRIRGDSMSPAIRDGWYVIIEPNSPITPGEYVLIVKKDGQSMIKELLWERDDHISLMSVNEAFDRSTLSSNEIDKIHHIAFIAPPSKYRL